MSSPQSFPGPGVPGGFKVKRHSGWHVPFLVVLGLAALGGAFLFYYLGPTVSDITGTAPKFTSSPQPVAVTLAGVPFNIPQNYTRLPKTRGGGAQDEVDLHALLPGLAPYSDDNADAFDNTTASSSVLFMTLRPNARRMSEHDRFERIYLNQVENRQGAPGPYELTRYVFTAQSNYPGQELYVGDDARGGKAIIVCKTESADEPVPTCFREIDLGGGVGFAYEYRRAQLENWRDIDARAYALATSFKSPGT